MTAENADKQTNNRTTGVGIFNGRKVRPTKASSLEIHDELAGYTLPELLEVKSKAEFKTLMDAVEAEVESGNLEWKYLDNDPNNVGQVNITSEPIMGLLENDANAKDAGIQKLIDWGYGKDAESPEDVIEEYVEHASDKAGKNLTVEQVFSRTDDPWVSIILQSQDRYYCMDDGSRDCVTIDIRDMGCGIPWDMVSKTILKFHSRSKTSDPRMIGKYGQGGSTALAHVSNRGGSLYVTCHHENPDVVTVPLVQCVLEEDSRNVVYVYLADAQTGCPVVLKNNHQFDSGTLIRHFGYKLHEKDLRFYGQGGRRKTSLYTTLTEMMVNPVIKTRIFDDRLLNSGEDVSKRQMRKTSKKSGEIIRGSLPRIQDAFGHRTDGQTEDDIVYISPEIEVPLSGPDSDRDLGTLELKYAVAGYLVDSKGDAKTYTYNFVNGGENGKFFLSGQAVIGIKTSILKEKLKFPYLKKFLLVYVSMDGLGPEAKSTVIQSNRASLSKAFEEKCYNAITEVMNDDEMLEHWNKQRKNTGSQSSVNRSVVDRLHEELGLVGGIGPDGPDTPPTRPDPPEPVTLKEPPTFFDLSTSDPRKVYQDKPFGICFTTDAPQSYLQLEGNLRIKSSNPDVVDASNVKPYSKGGSVPGYGMLRGFKVKEDVSLGEATILTVSLHHNQSGRQICNDRTEIVVSEKPQKRDVIKGYKIQPQMVDREKGEVLGLTDPTRHVATYNVDTDNKVFEIHISSYSKIYQQMQEKVRDDDRGAPGEATLRDRQQAAENNYQFYVAREAIMFYKETFVENPELSGDTAPAEKEEDVEPLTPFEQRVLGAASAGSCFLSDPSYLS